MPALTTIGFDADDTLWHNERFFQLTEARFREMLADHADAELVSSRLLEAERRNLGRYGFGIKGFVLSMIETALDVTGDTASPAIVRQILDAGREMLEHPVEALPEAQETLAALAGSYRLVLITKGDLFDQERKLAASGLGDYFDAVEIVSDKTAATYARLFARHGDGPARAMMVGNSLKSDVLPALAAGSFGVHVPHELTWALEHAEAPKSAPRFRQVDRLGEVPTILAEIG
ncbi:HAD family hydrolase [Aurantimonas coralicida]|uniref:HAD family hydrolase n=1 Tax=Aurantimonas coralicida TaxID=182270 RepID=UPI001E6318E8|nr:HAD family hydrolase [Aurantimonas coralicida]MCD1644617.1 HAD family hydrolase [Aurantimonas coralicida]